MAHKSDFTRMLLIGALLLALLAHQANADEFCGFEGDDPRLLQPSAGSSSRLFLQGGTVVNADGEQLADVYMEDGVIKAVGPDLKVPEGVPVIDATGKYVMPGGIDPHTHLSMPFMGAETVDDFFSGQAAALAGGTTFHIDFALPTGGDLAQGFRDYEQKGARAAMDYSFHMAVTSWSHKVAKDMADLVAKGINSFKFFMAYKGALQVSDEELLEGFQRCKELGALPQVHAENGDAVEFGRKKIFEMGITGPEGHGLSRPPVVEGEATARAIKLAKVVNVPLYVVHVMSIDALEEIARARLAGQRVVGEPVVAGLALDETHLYHPTFAHAANGRNWWVLPRSRAWFQHFLMDIFDEERWLKNMRMSRPVFMGICHRLRPRIALQNTNFRQAVPVEVKVGATIYKLATGCYNLEVSEKFHIGESTFAKHFKQVLGAIKVEYGDSITFPRDRTDIHRVVRGFKKVCGLPNCLGAIDGSHIPVAAPQVDALDYFNRKSGHSIVLQAMVDTEHRFLDISVGCPGSIHDSRVLRISGLYGAVERGEVLAGPTFQLRGSALKPYLLGDQGYPLLPWLMVLYPGRPSELNAAKSRFNRAHIRGRLHVEQAFGILKRRWSILAQKQRGDISEVPLIVRVCCILHNMLVRTEQVDVEDLGEHVPPSTQAARVARNDSVLEGKLIRDRLCEHLAHRAYRRQQG